ncbi:HK97 gp10 family phage protein [Rheinheimera maricola]|uniref:HK97 gp10 family phage protein n=1 Tax=Rheinheimera maricola TaxID=2793282 RepID=A0ABS7X9C2_9GAMM|nr:HK97 gp10 family phage protein [Rheinheimera maricola]MBZ9612144.1 HK97 gp10 family phage protein [Rheinheimera maricola]
MSVAKLSVEPKGFAELAALWQQAPELFEAELYAAAEESAMLVQREVVERTPMGAQNFLGRSIQAEQTVVFEGGVSTVVGTSLSYAVPVELGTKPHFPPLQPLAEWAEVVLKLDAEEAQRAAFAIARKISQKGTEGRFMFRDGFKASEPYIRRRFARAVANIKAQLAAL